MTRRYPKVLLAGLLSINIMTAVTLLGVLQNKTWHHNLIQFLHRACAAFLVAVGSTGPGFISPIVVSVLSALISIGLMGWLQGWAVFRRNAWENGLITLFIPTIVLILVYGPQFLWAVASTGYKEHGDTMSVASRLQEYAGKETQFQHELAEAKAKADNWRDAYNGISKDERVPDRILNAEETDKMHAELVQAATTARNAKNMKSVRIEVNPAFYDDRESTHLAFQLFNLFKASHWDANWPTVHGKTTSGFFHAHYPVGVIIYTDDRSINGDWLMWIMKDAGINATVAQEMVPGLQGTFICVGYKQFP
jgi:hypothetical protein